MSLDAAPWIPLTADRIATLPNGNAVFEIANLVRNVVYVGGAEGCLREAVRRLTQVPGRLPNPAGGLYLRYLPADGEADLVAERVRLYQQQHAGALPVANRPAARAVAARAQQSAA